jgi:hypothetical protein
LKIGSPILGPRTKYPYNSPYPLTSFAQAKTIRATELNAGFWSQLQSRAAGDVTVEFRQGDEIPVTFSAQGDFLESTQSGTTYVSVKRNFWIKIVGNDLEMSLDGATFKPLDQMVKRSISADAGAGSNPIGAINVVLQAFMK